VKDTLEALSVLARQGPRSDARLLSDSEAHAIIRAFRRRVPVRQIGAAMGCTGQGIYAKLGTWALHTLEIPEGK
jgi:hypothetical protein